MEKIILNNIVKDKNTIKYDFTITDGLSEYFSGKPFVIEYLESIEDVPDSVCAVPFVCCVLPIIWLTDSVLILNDIDKAFYDCIPDVRHGYEEMFPETDFKGEIQVKNIVLCDRPAENKSGTLFSGGMDAVTTLIRHIDEKPALVSIWGADISYDNKDAWDIVHKGIEEYAVKYNLPDVVIRSTFREFDKEGILGNHFHKKLKDGWWHGVKHSLALLGLTSPYVYLKGISTLYIASTNCYLDKNVRCASDPKTDNYVKFASACVVHDSFDLSRQDKAKTIVDYVKKTKTLTPVHVCWQSQNGGNCCHCEKCYRTISNFIAEGANPIDYGFPDISTTLPFMHECICKVASSSEFSREFWIHIRNRFIENKKQIKKSCYWKYVRWILNADFNHPEKIKMPLIYRIRVKLSQFRFYQFLSRVKEKIFK